MNLKVKITLKVPKATLTNFSLDNLYITSVIDLINPKVGSAKYSWAS